VPFSVATVLLDEACKFFKVDALVNRLNNVLVNYAGDVATRHHSPEAGTNKLGLETGEVINRKL